MNHWPQYTLAALMLMTAGLFLEKHGQPRTYNFWALMVDYAFLIWLLVEGGFFRGLA